MSVFAFICVRVSGRIYQKLITMVFLFGGGKKNLN